MVGSIGRVNLFEEVKKNNMVKLLSAIGILGGVCLVAACTKKQNYGGTAVQQAANGWWVTATSSQNGLLPDHPSAANHTFFSTYNSSANTKDSLWADDLGQIGGNYDVKALLSLNLSDYALTSGGTENLYQSTSSVQWAAGKIFPKGGLSRTGVATDSIFLQFLLTGTPGDTLTIKGVARTGFDADDWPASPYAPTP
jgi:hypothetical protein